MDDVARIRAFNRTWTEVLGLLDQGLLQTDRSLAEARVVFELAQRNSWERLELRHRLGMDASFLSRVIGRLESDDLVETSPSESDGRAIAVRLTDQGRATFDVLNRRSIAQINDLIQPLSADQRLQMVEAMSVIVQLVRPDLAERNVAFRPLAPGDLGWVIQRHGAVYADEFGWNADFEALVASIVADYHRNHKPGREAAWIAEVDGARAGCVFCCERDDDTAQLRILLVEPWARGLHLGRRLVDQCIDFATGAGYSAMMLWTNDVLVSARRIYEAAGFELVSSEPHHSFGHDLVGQDWELELGPGSRPGERGDR
jgi:DNA-binding MarR family transcriptional regulator/N-acetylglutamate synthase-like GNAT family acetyltransferase